MGASLQKPHCVSITCRFIYDGGTMLVHFSRVSLPITYSITAASCILIVAGLENRWFLFPSINSLGGFYVKYGRLTINF
jgi:hypothetical protein